ncbi:MAG: YggT family protein, partial [Chloroflexi bacterium]|nr:YggT family protein [Chloroflexota bacterium]
MTEPERPTDPESAPSDPATDPEAAVPADLDASADAVDAGETPAAADIVANLETAHTPDVGSPVDDAVPAAAAVPVEAAVPAEPVATTVITPPPAPPPPVVPAAAPVTAPVAAPVAPVQPPAITARRSRGLAGTLARIVTFLFGILQALLIVRILLLLLNANADNEIVSVILNITEPFVEPFRGMFQLDELTGEQGSVLDIAAIVALVAWTLIETLIVSVLRL